MPDLYSGGSTGSTARQAQGRRARDASWVGPGHPPSVSRRRERLELAGEIGWLLISTTLLILLVVEEPGYRRLIWLAMLVINAAVVGYRVRRMSRQLRSAQSRT